MKILGQNEAGLNGGNLNRTVCNQDGKEEQVGILPETKEDFECLNWYRHNSAIKFVSFIGFNAMPSLWLLT